jgi:hypothetical protein
MSRAFLEQTVERQGSLVFCVSKSSAVERERMQPLERMNVFTGNIPTQMLILYVLILSVNAESPLAEKIRGMVRRCK